MRVPDVYPILCDKLRALQALPYAKLQEMIDVMPTSIPIDIMNEAITIEVRVEWTDQRKRGMRINQCSLSRIEILLHMFEMAHSRLTPSTFRICAVASRRLAAT